MGQMSNANREQAVQNLADAIVDLYAEEFCRGSDSLGERGWDILSANLRVIAMAFNVAADGCARSGSGDMVDDFEPDPADSDDLTRILNPSGRPVVTRTRFGNIIAKLRGDQDS